MSTKSTLSRRCYRVGLAALALSVLSGKAATAQSSGNQRLSPDLLQTLGVGSRSIAMGNAYTAIADDASASFWNVGRLGFLRHDEFMLEYRPVVSSSLLSNNGALTIGIQPSKPQIGFAGLVIPVTSHRLLGSFGISYTEGGYFSANKDISTSSASAGVPAVTTVANSISQIVVRESYLTFAYGQQFQWTRAAAQKKAAADKNAPADKAAPGNAKPPEASKLGVGVGVFFVNQEYSTVTQSTTTQNGTTISDSGIIPVSERGTGVGATFGLAYDPANSQFHYGLSYRSKTSLSGLTNGQSFGTQTPDHLSIGVAYLPKISRHARKADAKDAGDADTQQLTDVGSEPRVPVTISAEVQVFSAVNLGTDVNGQLNELDRRRAVSNFHLGLEYRPPVLRIGRTDVEKNDNPHYEYAFRLGFHTNANAATVYTYYDNVVSFGVALQLYHRQKLTWSLEPAAEILTNSGLTQFTLTGRASF